MRCLIAVVLLALPASAQFSPEYDLRFAFWVGIDRAIHRQFDKPRTVQLIAAQPETTLRVCSFGK